MKYATDMKIAGFVGNGIASISVKKKNGLLISITDTNFYGGGMTADIGGSHVSIRFIKAPKGTMYAVVSIPTKGREVRFKCKTEKKFKEFINTDYHGFKRSFRL